MKLNHVFYEFCPHFLIPREWGELLKKNCEQNEMVAEISPDFYLYILGSISLNAHEKLNILQRVEQLTSEQISQLEEVFKEEVVNFGENFDDERAYLTKIFCENLFSITLILRLYNVIVTPREENKILKKIINHWLSNSETCLQILQLAQGEFPMMKHILRYYDPK